MLREFELLSLFPSLFLPFNTRSEGGIEAAVSVTSRNTFERVSISEKGKQGFRNTCVPVFELEPISLLARSL